MKESEVKTIKEPEINIEFTGNITVPLRHRKIIFDILLELSRMGDMDVNVSQSDKREREFDHRVLDTKIPHPYVNLREYLCPNVDYNIMDRVDVEKFQKIFDDTSEKMNHRIQFIEDNIIGPIKSWKFSKQSSIRALKDIISWFEPYIKYYTKEKSSLCNICAWFDDQELKNRYRAKIEIIDNILGYAAATRDILIDLIEEIGE